VRRGRPHPLLTFPGPTDRRLEGRVGGTKAALAVAHKILVMVSHLLREGTGDEEKRDARLQDRQEEHQQKGTGKALERLGYRVTLERLASRSGVSPLVLHALLASPSWEQYASGRGAVYLRGVRDVVGSVMLALSARS
jgi:hypothetical protein